MLVRIPFLILFISFSFIGIGQISFQETVLKLYPEIEIRFNYRDPSGIDTNKVRFYESGKMIEKYHLSKQDSAKNIYKRKQVLILIENSYWSRFESQREAVKNLWSKISDSVFLEGDEFYLATFDWSKGGRTLIFSQTHSFENGLALNTAIQQISAPKKDGRLHESTEIYSALREGVSFLSDLPRDSLTAPVILLFSSEFNNVFNNSQTKSDVIIEARKAGIPIYTFRYAFSSKYDLTDVSNATYGTHVDMGSSSNDFIINIINQIPFTASGNDYIISYKSESIEYGDLRNFEIEISNDDKFSLNFQAPTRISVLIKETWFRLALFVMFLLVLFVGAWIYQFYKKRKNQEKLEIQRIHEETQRKIEENEMIYRIEKQSERKKIEYEQQQSFEASLNKIIRSLPRRPSLILQDGSSIEIDNPVFSIGRIDGNSLTISNNTLSKVHAVICFAHEPTTRNLTHEKEFYLVDSNSTNGTLLNGQKVPTKNELSIAKAPKLKNHDLIQMGEISFTFIE